MKIGQCQTYTSKEVLPKKRITLHNLLSGSPWIYSAFMKMPGYSRNSCTHHWVSIQSPRPLNNTTSVPAETSRKKYLSLRGMYGTARQSSVPIKKEIMPPF